MRQVTKDEFYQTIGKLDVEVVVRGRYVDPDYGSDFKTKRGVTVGRTVQKGVIPEWKPRTDYFLL